MGEKCSKFDNRERPNAKKIGLVPDCEITNVVATNICTGKDEVAVGFCESLGINGEWGSPDSDILIGKGCYVWNSDEGDTPADGKSGCCKGNCITKGFGKGRANCIRKGYTADKSLCCFMDYECGVPQFEDACFQTSQRQRTCGPEYRNLSSSSCQDEIFDYCVGNKLYIGQEHWLDLWMDDVVVDLNFAETLDLDEDGNKLPEKT